MVEFAEGESTQVVEVNFIDDDIVEPKESLYAQLKAVNKDDKISGGMNKLEILDNDIYATYELTSAQIDGLNSGQVIEGVFRPLKLKEQELLGFCLNLPRLSSERKVAALKDQMITQLQKSKKYNLMLDKIQYIFQ